jgi:hypothetical protein
VTKDKEPNVEELMKEVADLKQANENLIKLTFGIINNLDIVGKDLISASNALFTISGKLKAVVQNSK